MQSGIFACLFFAALTANSIAQPINAVDEEINHLSERYAEPIKVPAIVKDTQKKVAKGVISTVADALSKSRREALAEEEISELVERHAEPKIPPVVKDTLKKVAKGVLSAVAGALSRREALADKLMERNAVEIPPNTSLNTKRGN
uniref:Hymenochirin 1 n=1 Tax=Hymenochirus boettgeri TaxID=247094 RepID=W8PA68_9PIPI|nr:hymenochirin precursor 1 [Hymenochirus boettgeri]